MKLPLLFSFFYILFCLEYNWIIYNIFYTFFSMIFFTNILLKSVHLISSLKNLKKKKKKHLPRNTQAKQQLLDQYKRTISQVLQTNCYQINCYFKLPSLREDFDKGKKKGLPQLYYSPLIFSSFSLFFFHFFKQSYLEPIEYIKINISRFPALRYTP